MNRETTGLEIAVIGMAGRFPGADSVSAFWDNIVQGRERIGHEPPAGPVRPDFVPAWGRLDGIDRFDAAYFGYTPRDAALLDPQHRLFLQTAHHALEHAGYAGQDRPAHIGVYASCSMSTYLLRNILGNPAARNASYGEQILGNDKDMLAARTSYHLDLQGPSMTVQSACSSSLVAVHLAGQALLSRDCEIALAGGVSIQPPQRGYHPEPGGVLSPDGHCRPFDAGANGMVPGSGVAIVVLKTLSDALRDNDTIHAVILGSAVNNDGGAKVGFTAPRIDSQAAMVLGAQRFAGIQAESIGYVEAHGTGTPLGDPIEVAALTRAFRASTARRGFCGLGSVKSLIGHLDAAAGVTGLIKAILAVRFGVVPPSAYLSEPNPQLRLDESPFFLPARAQPWPPSAGPRRAAVSSIGMGGTNAHAIVEQAPEPPSLPAGGGGRWQVLALSARDEAALTRARQQLAHRLSAPDAPDLADAAYTLQLGRRVHSHRMVVLSRDHAEAVRRLRDGGDGVFQRHQDSRGTPVAFMFTGQGGQHPGMGRALHRTEPAFRAALDEMADLLRPHGIVLPELLDAGDPGAAGRLTHTANAQPALFALEFALARLLMSWGLRPHAMIGHSVGEYVAACVAGVFSPADAVALVVRRGQLMGRLPAGAMLAVGGPATEVARDLDPGLVIAADNGPRTCVVAGEIPVVQRYAERLGRAGVDHRRLQVSHAFHSPMVEPMLDEFAAAVVRVKRAPPTIPFVSCLTGDWITAAEATDPSYWARQAAHTVRFREGVASVLAAAQQQILFETGPGQTLCGLAREQADPARHTIVPTLAGPKQEQPDERVLAAALGRAWLAGAALDWRRVHAVPRRRVELPGYPFEPTRHWIEPEGVASQDIEVTSAESTSGESTSDDVAEQIRGIWAEMLGMSGIGHDDDFFALGGTSMLATRVTGRINDRFGVRLPAGAIFEAPTVAGLATTVWGALAGGEEALLDEIKRLSASAALDGHRP